MISDEQLGEYWQSRRPTRDRLVVRLWNDQEQAERDGQLIEVRRRRPRLSRGTVLSVGPQVVDLRAGDDIAFSSRYPDHAPGARLLVLREHQVMALLEA